MEYNLFFVAFLFVATCIITVLGFYAASKSRTFLIFSLCWILIQSVLGLSGFYKNINLVPPRIMLFGLLPILLIFASTFLSIRGKKFVDSIDLKLLTYCHTIRIPIEIILTLLYHNGLMSVLVTFEGNNFDIFSGVSAPIIIFCFRKMTYSSPNFASVEFYMFNPFIKCNCYSYTLYNISSAIVVLSTTNYCNFNFSV